MAGPVSFPLETTDHTSMASGHTDATGHITRPAKPMSMWGTVSYGNKWPADRSIDPTGDLVGFRLKTSHSYSRQAHTLLFILIKC